MREELEGRTAAPSSSIHCPMRSAHQIDDHIDGQNASARFVGGAIVQPAFHRHEQDRDAEARSSHASTNQTNGLVSNGMQQNGGRRSDAVDGERRGYDPTRDNRRGPAKQPATKPAKYHAPSHADRHGRRSLRYARAAASSVPISPFPIRKKTVENRRAVMPQIWDCMTMTGTAL